jgi:twitching motility protein PilT
VSTPTVIEAMVAAGDGISDLVFSPGRPPQVERYGQLEPVDITGLPTLGPADTAALASDLIGGNELALRTLKEQGACDLSYVIPRALPVPRQTSSGSAARSRSSCGSSPTDSRR